MKQNIISIKSKNPYCETYYQNLLLSYSFIHKECLWSLNFALYPKECVCLNQSILKLRLFTYFLLDKKIWWFLSAVLSKMTLPNKSSPKNENRNEFISHFVDMLGLYQQKAMQYESINFYLLINSCNFIKNISIFKDENALKNQVQFDRNLVG